MNTETSELLPLQDATLIPTEPALPPQPSTLHKIFIGKDGLRAGWSLAIFTLRILAVLVVAVNVIGHKFFPRNPKVANDASVITIKSGFIQESIPIVLVLFVTWIMSKIERRPNSVYGLGGSRKLPHFLRRIGVGSRLPFAPCGDSVEDRTAGHRPAPHFWRRRASLRSNLAAWLPFGWTAGGVSDARLPAIHSDARPCRHLPVDLQDPL